VGTIFPSCAHKQCARRQDARTPSVRDGHSNGHLLSSAWEDADGLLDTGANEDIECDTSRAGDDQADGSDGGGAGGELRASWTRRSPDAPRLAPPSFDRTLVVPATRTPSRPWPRMIWWPSALALCAVRWVGLRAKGRRVEARGADVPWCCKVSLRQSGRGQESVSHAHIDHGIKLCLLFVDLGHRALSGVQKYSKTICTDIQWESSSHQHLQIRQLSGEVAAKCSWTIIPIRWLWSFCVSCWELSWSRSKIILGIVLRTVLASEYNHPGDHRHRLSERVRKIDLDCCLKDLIVHDNLDYCEWRREEGLPIREQDLPMGRCSCSTKLVQREPQCDLIETIGKSRTHPVPIYTSLGLLHMQTIRAQLIGNLVHNRPSTVCPELSIPRFDTCQTHSLQNTQSHEWCTRLNDGHWSGRREWPKAFVHAVDGIDRQFLCGRGSQTINQLNKSSHFFRRTYPRWSVGRDDTASGTIPESVPRMIPRTSPETVGMNSPITEVSRVSGNLNCRIISDPRNCCAHDHPNSLTFRTGCSQSVVMHTFT